MIFRKKKNQFNPFVMVDKEWVNNPDISAKAKGVLLYLVSKPDDWTVYEADISNHMKDGIKAIRSAVRELMEYGYIHRKRVRNDCGHFQGYEYFVSENPYCDPIFTEVPFSDIRKRHTTNTERTNGNWKEKFLGMTLEERHCREDDEKAARCHRATS